jgi:hypothetical protein
MELVCRRAAHALPLIRSAIDRHAKTADVDFNADNCRFLLGRAIAGNLALGAPPAELDEGQGGTGADGGAHNGAPEGARIIELVKFLARRLQPASAYANRNKSKLDSIRLDY